MAVRTKPFYPVQEMEHVLKNLNRVARKIKGGNLKGLVRSGLLIQREAQKICPVDVGNLRSSSYTVWSTKVAPQAFLEKLEKKSFQGKISPKLKMEYQQVLTDAKVRMDRATTHDIIMVEVGFTAYYAIYVHEDPKAFHKPGTQWKYLQSALFKNQGRIIQIIVQEARI